MKLALIVVACLVCTALAHGAYDEMIEIYGKKKIMESCFGKSTMEAIKNEVVTMLAACKNEVAPSTVATNQPLGVPTDLQTFLAALRSQQGGQSPLIIPIPVYAGGKQYDTTRTRRSTYFTEEKVRSVKDAAVQKKNLALCFLHKAKYLHPESNAVQWTAIEAKLDKYSHQNAQLNKDIKEAMNKCKEFSTAMSSLMKSNHQIPYGMKQIMFYKKCMSKKQIMACMKKDFAEKSHEFELQGLDGLLDGLDESEKIVALVKMFMKFGDDELSFLKY